MANGEDSNRKITMQTVMSVIQILIIPAIAYLGSMSEKIAASIQDLRESQIRMEATIAKTSSEFEYKEMKLREDLILRSKIHHTSMKSCIDCKVPPTTERSGQ